VIVGPRQLVLTSNNDGIRVREGLEQYEVDGHLVRLFIILGLAYMCYQGKAVLVLR
jgi:hypothetical protein